MRKYSASLTIAALFVTALLLAACGGESGTTTTTTTETLEEILAQAADVKLVKYDCAMTTPRGEQVSRVWLRKTR